MCNVMACLCSRQFFGWMLAVLCLLSVVAVVRWTGDSEPSIPSGEYLQRANVGLPEIFATEPGPEYTPTQIVQTQLEALRIAGDADEEDIATCFRFASPANRAATGPLDRFVQMVKSPPFNSLLGHQSSKVVRTELRGDQAVVVVVLADSTGVSRHFLFMLSKQQIEPYVGCWMTDSVSPVMIGCRACPSGALSRTLFEGGAATSVSCSSEGQFPVDGMFLSNTRLPAVLSNWDTTDPLIGVEFLLTICDTKYLDFDEFPWS